VKKADITSNSAAEMVLLFHYLVSDFSGCVQGIWNLPNKDLYKA